MSREMKESGVDWIGAIPKGWRLLRNKNVFTCSKELIGDQSATTQLLSLTTHGVKEKNIEDVSGKQPESFDSYQVVEPSDIVMCLFDLDCSAVFSGISNYCGMISPAYKVMSCKEHFFPEFYDLWFDYVFDGRKFSRYAKNLRYTLNYDEFAALPVLAPTEEEQKRIASYLRKKCNEIDKIVTDTERSIEEYKKLKQSIITEAVTKGVRGGNCEMKDSGIDWIGQIPKEWHISKLFYCLKCHICDGPHETPRYITSGVPFISVDSLNDTKKVNLDVTKKYISEDDYDIYYKKAKLEQGDVLFTKSATIGKTAIVGDEKFMIWSPIAIIKTNPKKMNNVFLYYLLNCQQLIKHIELSGSFSTQSNVGMREIEQAIVPLPDLSIQKEIINYLDEECSKIDNLLDSKRRQLDDLLKYKQSIIYEYVTGKKEVPEQ